MDRFRREHEVRVLLEVRVDVAIHTCQTIRQRSAKGLCLLSVAVARDNTTANALEQSSKLPRSRTTLGVSTDTLLRHDRDCIARSAVYGRKDVVPDVGLITLLHRNSQYE